MIVGVCTAVTHANLQKAWGGGVSRNPMAIFGNERLIWPCAFPSTMSNETQTSASCCGHKAVSD